MILDIVVLVAVAIVGVSVGFVIGRKSSKTEIPTT